MRDCHACSCSSRARIDAAVLPPMLLNPLHEQLTDLGVTSDMFSRQRSGQFFLKRPSIELQRPTWMVESSSATAIKRPSEDILTHRASSETSCFRARFTPRRFCTAALVPPSEPTVPPLMTSHSQNLRL